MATVSKTSPDLPDLKRLQSQPAAVTAALEIFWQAGQKDDATALLQDALPVVLNAAGGDFAAVAVPDGGRWSTTAQAGARQVLPVELLADVLDRERPVGKSPWFAAPIDGRSTRGEVLVVHLAPGATPGTLELVESLAGILAVALTTARKRREQRQRIERLQAILHIAQQWNQTHEMEPLLVQMAEAATRLLSADRASIFLWDRSTHMLVGRPALGVEEGELRIPDDAGVVGQVVQSGQPRRVHAAAGQSEIDRRVDQQLGYKTQTLLCVPMRSGDGELIGAFEVLNKRSGNFSDEDEAALSELASHAAIALQNTQERESLLLARRQITEQAAQGITLVGDCPAIEALRSTIRRVAAADLAVLILGENGSGKEVVAQSIHYLSKRREGPFVAVNCAAIAETLLESELFGHEKGAFTDAHEARPGKFELASGGTLFLDEIGDLSLSGQAKLLRVLEEKVIVRVGGSKQIHTDARVLAATNQSLVEMVRAKKFREDLYFRLNVVTLTLPPLRDRGEDVMRLAEHFLRDFSKRAGRRPPKLTPAARKRLLEHPWPGNIRELRNLMERLAYLLPEDKIEAEDLAFILTPGTPRVSFEGPLADATQNFQIEYIKQAIERTRGNMSEAAEHLGLHRSNLYRKMRQLGMEVNEER